MWSKHPQSLQTDAVQLFIETPGVKAGHKEFGRVHRQVVLQQTQRLGLFLPPPHLLLLLLVLVQKVLLDGLLHCLFHLFGVIKKVRVDCDRLYLVVSLMFTDLFKDLVGKEGAPLVSSGLALLQRLWGNQHRVGSLSLLSEQLDDHCLHVKEQHMHVRVRQVGLHCLDHKSIMGVLRQVSLEERELFSKSVPFVGICSYCHIE